MLRFLYYYYTIKFRRQRRNSTSYYYWNDYPPPNQILILPTTTKPQRQWRNRTKKTLKANQRCSTGDLSDEREPCQNICSWVSNCPRRAGRQQQQIKHSLSETLIKSLDFNRDNLNDWTIEGKDTKKWAQKIRATKLQLTPNTYKPL